MVALLVVASACGGGDSGGDTATTGVSDGAAVSSEDTDATAASPEGMVKSVDGLATLSLPAGSLPEGVSPGDIHIEARFSDSDDPAMPIVAVQLLPSGLELGEPAALTIALPEAPAGGFIAILSSGDFIEFLDGQIEEVDGEFSLTTSVEHFSFIIIFDAKLFFETTLQVDFPTVSEGDTQTATATITRKQEDIDLLIPFESDDPGTARLVTVAAQAPFFFQDEVIIWEEDDPGTWDPFSISVGLAETFDGWETTPATSQCQLANNLDPSFRSAVAFYLRLVNLVGPPQDEALFVFGQLGGSSPTSRAALPNEGLDLMNMARDDTFLANAYPRAVTPSTCTEGEESGTATETPETEVAIAIGQDPADDCKKDSERGECKGGGDLKNVSEGPGPSGESCFTIQVYGDGETAAADASNYVIGIEVVDPGSEGGGWGTEVRLGRSEPWYVFLGLYGPGRDILEGAAVTAAWDDNDTVQVCVDGGETTLGVETFTVSILVFTPDGVFFDDAEGVGAS